MSLRDFHRAISPGGELGDGLLRSEEVRVGLRARPR